MNYFELLGVSQNETNEQVLAEAYQRARVKWQTLLNQGIGEQQRQAREAMNGGLEAAYETLSDATKRQQYLRQLKLAHDAGIPLSYGQVRVSFSLANGHSDHEFLVIENPVRHPLEAAPGLRIRSIQEYICRVWEDPELGLGHVLDRTLERWAYYSAGEAETANLLRYLRWEPDAVDPDRQLFVALDLLQSKYPVPMLPRSPRSLLEQAPTLCAPQWRIAPGVADFGLLSGDTPTQLTLFVKTWPDGAGQVTASVDHPALRLDCSQLHAQRLDLAIEVAALERGSLLESAIHVQSERFGSLEIPVVAARPNRLLGNRELANKVHGLAGEAALRQGDLPTALRCFRVSGQRDGAMRAAKGLLQRAYARHDWTGIIRLARYYQDQFGDGDDAVRLWLVEALRMVGGSLYQLGEQRRSLEYLAALAYEAAQMEDPSALAQSWTAQPETQLRLNLTDPKADWVDLAEHYALNWTHAKGRADGSQYVGEVPLDLSARRIVWQTAQVAPLKPPLLAYEGMLLARRRDGLGVLALDAASGEQRWTHTWAGAKPEAAAPVAGEGRFFVADPSGTLRALDVVSGQVVWATKLDDNRDLSLAYSDGLLYVGTGKRLAVLAAATGEQLAASDEMKTFFGWMDANPVNLLVSDGCCLFQKVGGVDHSLVFLEVQSGTYYEFPTPFGHSWTSSLLGTLVAGSAWTTTAWAAYEGEIYLPYYITKQIECRSQVRDSDGKLRERVERKSWGEVHLFVYNARHNQMLAHVWEVANGTAYAENKQCKESIQEVRSATTCAVAPAYVQVSEQTNYVNPPQEGKPLHRLVAAAFGREVFYWIVTDTVVKRAGYRVLDGEAQALAYCGLYDLVTTANSLSTSFLGSTEEGDATFYSFPGDIGGVVGSPAPYGDIIHLLTRAGQVAALGR